MTPGTLLTRTKHWLKLNNIRLSKQLGQHFLVDDTVLMHIIEYSHLRKDEQVLEIGTGNGILTRELAEHVQLVNTIEKDIKFYQILADEFEANTRIQLILGDATNIEWPPCDKLIANLPYAISSPILFKLFTTNIPLAVVMLQKEFGDRLSAKPGLKQYGRLTVMAAYYSKIELLEVIPPDAFYPPPTVSSALVRITRNVEPAFEVKELALFQQVVTALFNQRRKKIRTPLKAFLGKTRFQQIEHKIPWIDQRVEALTPIQIAEIANLLYEEQVV
ncbi:MAG: 16S rRNA (adenine(1518)-N(6)/adenine(1519)-N(6))-dimethyltransferase RsmA [Promethearchaeota archaeon]